MENVKIVIDGIKKDVYGLFYIYDSKYYFIYTEKELDDNGYVILYMAQVGMETQNTSSGLVNTGNMVGVEITNPEDQQKIQTSISYIVEDKKNNTINPQIQYLPMSMLTNLKIISKKRFRLLKSIMEDNFKLNFIEESNESTENINVDNVTPIVSEPQPHIETSEAPIPLQNINKIDQSLAAEPTNNTSKDNANVVIDYRAKYFEEEEKNKELQEQINLLTQKLEEIKKVIE